MRVIEEGSLDLTVMEEERGPISMSIGAAMDLGFGSSVGLNILTEHSIAAAHNLGLSVSAGLTKESFLAVTDALGPEVLSTSLILTEATAYADVVLADSPEAYWRLGSSPTVDASGNGHTLTATGSPGSVSSLISNDGGDSARSFAAGAYYDAADAAEFDVTGTSSFTIEAWIRTPSSVDPDQVMIATHLGGETVDGWKLGMTGTGSFKGISIERWKDSAAVEARYDFTPASSTVYHVVATYDGADLKIYVDGVLRDTTADTASMDAVAGTVGIGYSTFSGANEFAGGHIDEVAFYTTALTLTQVEEHYDVGTGGSSEPAPIAGQGYEKVFEDDFTTLDIGDQNTWTSNLWYESEAEAGQLTINGSILEMRAGDSGPNVAISTIWNTDPPRGGRQFRYGYFEMRARWSYDIAGSWPALWLLSVKNRYGENAADPATSLCSEFDIFEGYTPSSGNQPFTGALHRNTNGLNGVSDNVKAVHADPVDDYDTEFHTYAGLWTADAIEWYFDDALVGGVVSGDPDTTPWDSTDQDMFLIIDMWLTSTPPGGADALLEVDWVRVWQIPE